MEQNGSDSPLLPPTTYGGRSEAMFVCLIDRGTPNELLCNGYKRSWWKTSLVILGTICSVGFLQLIFYWRPDWQLKCTHSKSRLHKMTAVSLAQLDTKQVFVAKILYMPKEKSDIMVRAYPENTQSGFSKIQYSSSQTEDKVMYFKHQEALYFLNGIQRTFEKLRSLEGRASLAQIHQGCTSGLSEDEMIRRNQLYGDNVITVKIPSYFHLLVSEILNPFYVFQLFAVIFWCIDSYYIYAGAIFVISLISAVTSLIQVRRERVNLHEMVKYHNEIKMTAIRLNDDGSQREKEVLAKDLVPGDVIVIPPHGAQLACDVALVSGTCIVKESMLTGESVPITKTPIPSSEAEMANVYTANAHKRHTLFCGTQVLQTRFYPGETVKGVVVRTGFHTAKGQLIHSILYPKPVDMKLMRDAYRFVGVLFFIAVCGFVYTVIIQHQMGLSVGEILLNAIDLITISVPPALPLAMTIGIIYAQLRLKDQKIHCISPQRINISGQVDVVAFDKTGTLTEDGLDLALLRPVNHSPRTLLSANENTADVFPTFMPEVEPRDVTEAFDVSDPMLACMGTCHTLTTIDGELCGDPLDVKMFEATGWDFVEPKVEDAAKYDQLQTTYVTPKEKPKKLIDVGETEDLSHDIGILRQFPFSSSLQRASVIVKPISSAQKDMIVYVKGAPETVSRLCLPSTVPDDFKHVLQSYTKQGYRMIAMATKKLTMTWKNAQKVERSAVECELTFLGLMALQNQLKPESTKAHEKLSAANIRTLMVTGDNILTSLSVARECGMVGSKDDVLVAHATPPTDTQPATLVWESPDGGAGSKSSRSSSTNSSSNTVAGKNQKNQTEIQMEPPNTWHLAVSGPEMSIIQRYFPEWVGVLATKGTVFARMSPQQKTELMEDLESVGYHVCMCGDGANDCGALKRAHTGISLSEYEASVAAPFTSHTDYGIQCVPTLIRECRAALVTSFGMFKFMALYSIIQFCSITLLYNDLSSFSDLQFLYVDLIIIDLVAITMSRNHAHKHLHRKRPHSSLVSPEMLFSLLSQIGFQLAAQIVIFFLVKQQCWYTPLPPALVNGSTFNGTNLTLCPQIKAMPNQSHVENADNVLTYEATSIFFLSSFLYLSVSVAFSRGKPFRTSFYRNYAFLVSLLGLVGFTVFLMYGAPLPLADFMQIRVIPDPFFLLIILLSSLAHFVVSVIFELAIVEQTRLWDFVRGLPLFRDRRRANEKKYKTILRDLSEVDVEGSPGGRRNVPFPEVNVTFSSKSQLSPLTRL